MHYAYNPLDANWPTSKQHVGPISLSCSVHPNTSSTANIKLTRTRCHQNDPASSYHSCSYITSLAKNPRENPLQNPVPNQQLSPVLAYLPSRAFHHSANPLYPIILLSNPFSTPGHLSSHVLQKSNNRH